MMNNSLSLLLALAIVVSIAACSEQKSVDKQYLHSEQYNKFKKRTVLESQQKAQKALSLKSFLQQFRNCAELPLEPLPAYFDAEKINQLSQSAPDTCSINMDLQGFKMLAETFTSDHVLRWILLDRKTAYRDQELIVSTFRDDQLRSFKTVGIYKKNPSENVTSEVRVRPANGHVRIKTHTTRNILYPIEQTNNIESMYAIDELGDISERQESTIE